MVRADVSEVARLEERTFTLAWKVEGFERFVADPGRLAWVAVDARDGVAGYAAVDLDGKTAHLMNFAVRRDVRRKGVGTRLMRELLGALRWRGAKRLYLEVRASNAPAQAFYGRSGFIVRRTRRSYYRDNSEDARVMELRLNRGDTQVRNRR